MSQLQDRIAQFRKMSQDDPENELGHYRLGTLLMEAGQYEDAIASFRRTLELSPQFSKVYLLLGQCLSKVDKGLEAIQTLKKGFGIADERGDNIPRDEMSKLLVELGEPAPVSVKQTPAGGVEGVGGFRCQRPGCFAGARAMQLAKAPFGGELGCQIHERVCAECWDYWFKNLSIKVINEMRLDLSDERNAEVYDQVMRETLGLT
ncbi:MAG: Fe(2+)-trafficking protein [Gemmataceae bacterium]